MQIERFQPGTRMSQATTCAGLVFLAGQVAKKREGDVQSQTREVLDTIESLLAEAGADKSTILSANIWLADIADFRAMNEVWDAWVDRDHLPARACVEARLAFPEFRVEIAVIAAKRSPG
ncbi:MAG: RidA family protein [Pseudomonadota bacterium]